MALERLGIAVAMVSPPYDAARVATDGRTTALIGPSVELLKNLGVWQRCAVDAAPLNAVRIADDREAMVRAPEVIFDARELGLEPREARDLQELRPPVSQASNPVDPVCA